MNKVSARKLYEQNTDLKHFTLRLGSEHREMLEELQLVFEEPYHSKTDIIRLAIESYYRQYYHEIEAKNKLYA